MSATVLYMSMSLDGFIADPDEDPGRLHDWVFPGAENGDFEAAVARLRGVNRQIYDEFMSTGAILAGRGTFEPAGGWGGDHHDGVPIYILSRNPAPDWAADWPNVHYVSDLEVAVHEAKAEIGIHLVPILFGEGRRLFDHLGPQQRQLERISVREGEDGVTHLRFRVLR